MFRQEINNTPFFPPVEGTIFTNVYVTRDGHYDCSIGSTLRALVSPRMDEGEELICSHIVRESFEVSPLLDSKSQGNEDGINNFVRSMSRELPTTIPEKGSVYIIDFTSFRDDIDLAFNAVKDRFCNLFVGWNRLDKMELFYKSSFKCLCFINSERKVSALFVANMTVAKWHYLQCSIPAFLPWYFTEDKPLADDEMRLIKSLTQNDASEYKNALAQIAIKYELREKKISALLNNFETAYSRREIVNTRDKINNIIVQLEDLNRRIREYNKEKFNLEIFASGLEQYIAENSGSEMMDYFLCNKNLELESGNDRQITFVINDYLEYFDSDMAKTMIENRASYVYKPESRCYDDIIPRRHMQLLMDALFIKQTLKIKFSAAYRFEMNAGVTAISRYDYGDRLLSCLPNPHIDRYSCLGNYEEAINELISRGDYIMAIDQCVASCKSLNFGDSCVMSEFMLLLYGKSEIRRGEHRCIELPNGEVVTPKVAINYLIEQEQAEKEQGGQTEDE